MEAFADLMEAKLRENDHKGGWIGCDGTWLFTRLQEEVREVAELPIERIQFRWQNGDPDVNRQRLARECADVANFAMMLVDVCGALPRKLKGI